MKHIGTIALNSKRLALRRFTIDDAEAMFTNWASDDNVTRYLTWPTHKSIDDSKQFINFCLDGYKDLPFYNWAIELKDTHELIGKNRTCIDMFFRHPQFVQILHKLNSPVILPRKKCS